MQGSFKLLLAQSNFEQILDALVALQRELLPKGVDLVAALDEALAKAKPQPRGFEGLKGFIGQAQAEDVRDVMRESVEMIPEFEDVLRGHLLGVAEMAKAAEQNSKVAAAFAGFNANLHGSLRDMLGKLPVAPQEMKDFLQELEIRSPEKKKKEPPPEVAPTYDPAAIEKQFAEARAALKTELASQLAKGGVAAEEIMAELFDPKPPEKKQPEDKAPQPEGEQKLPQENKAAVEKQFKETNNGFKDQLGEQLKKAGVEAGDIAEIMAELFPKG